MHAERESAVTEAVVVIHHLQKSDLEQNELLPPLIGPRGLFSRFLMI
jgi:hypothetical protein